MNTYDIICLGEMLIDFTPDKKPMSYTANPGGAPANVAVSAARNGLKSAFLGKLGNDDFGHTLMKLLEFENITPLCRNLCNEAVTTLAFVTLFDNGERSFTFARKPGADMLLKEEDIREEDIKSCRILHTGSFSLSEEPCKNAVKKALRLAHDFEIPVSFDVNYRDTVWSSIESCKKEVDDILPFIDFLKISDEELYFTGGEKNIPNFMKKNNIKLTVETLGSKGAKCFFKNNVFTIPPLKVNAVDATGAGDAFWGAFLSYLLIHGVNKPEDINEALIRNAVCYGNVSGGICVESKGGIPSIPNAEEINRRILETS